MLVLIYLKNSKIFLINLLGDLKIKMLILMILTSEQPLWTKASGGIPTCGAPV